MQVDVPCSASNERDNSQTPGSDTDRRFYFMFLNFLQLLAELLSRSSFSQRYTLLVKSLVNDAPLTEYEDENQYRYDTNHKRQTHDESEVTEAISFSRCSHVVGFSESCEVGAWLDGMHLYGSRPKNWPGRHSNESNRSLKAPCYNDGNFAQSPQAVVGARLNFIVLDFRQLSVFHPLT